MHQFPVTMSKNNLITSRSVSPASFNSLRSSSEKSFENGLDNGSKTPKIRPSSTSKSTKAKRVRFYHNGNKFFNGVIIPVTPERYRSFDSLTNELTNLIGKCVTLPNGVRNVYSMEGKKVLAIEELEDGKEYVVSGKGEPFKKVDYSKTDTLKSKKVLRNCNSITTMPKVVSPDCVRPRIVTIIKHGIKPRKILRILLDKRNSSSMESVLSAFSELSQLAVRKVYILSGQQVTELAQLFKAEDVFLVYGNERHTQEDFELDFEESKAIQQYKKSPGRRSGKGPMPKMPEKDLNRDATLENNVALPPGMKGKYTVGRILGDGNFAVVRLCKHVISETEYALKIIDKSKCIGKEEVIENEVNILRAVSHPNIIYLLEDHDTKQFLYLVCEYVAGGDLFDVITVAQKFSEDQAALMVKHLVSGLTYLHNLNIVHRDVKPENLLVEMDKGKVKCLKLGDFGLACEVTSPLYTVCGTPTYVAPEILTECGYGLKIDVWAAGVILYILLSGYPPFASIDNDQEKLFDCILAGQYDFPDEFWQDVSSSAKELIQNMLQLVPELRFSAEDVLDHPWLQLSN
ncbi:serine/threonine-protein kinase GL21140 [Euwallacea fornicatus]|uniref:serine/threonine-protein kinase GL21140 n=1 Tax=Euwallacea fornicatus TaxID=995702 RepID=UPI00338EA2C8